MTAPSHPHADTHAPTCPRPHLRSARTPPPDRHDEPGTKPGSNRRTRNGQDTAAPSRNASRPRPDSRGGRAESVAELQPARRSRRGRDTTIGRAAAHRDPQHGGASVIALGVGLCVLVFAMVALLLAAAIEARHRAQIGADVAALAGAMRAGQGAAPACERAAQLAVANHTMILDCELSGMDITVEVSAPLPGPLQRFGPVTGHARAGPIAMPSR